MAAYQPEAEWLPLIRQAEMNLSAMELYSRLLYHPRPFSPAEIADFAKALSLPVEEAYPVLLTAACGLESDRQPRHRLLAEKYLSPALRPLDAARYRQNFYYAQIRFPEASRGKWRLTRLRYAPYEVFPCGNLRLLPDGREIQPLGYFDQEFSYPAVLENGREWMTITPNEIETMRQDLSLARGNILVFGLGLGYFALMAAEKEEVLSVTVIERDRDVLALFREYLLPQFPHADKIRLLCCDAFGPWAEQLPGGSYDFAYFDLWHDAGDGLPLYMRLRQMPTPLSLPLQRYWIEEDLLLFFKGLLLDAVQEGHGPLFSALMKERASVSSPEEMLSLPSLRRLSGLFPPAWLQR